MLRCGAAAADSRLDDVDLLELLLRWPMRQQDVQTAATVQEALTAADRASMTRVSSAPLPGDSSSCSNGPWLPTSVPLVTRTAQHTRSTRMAEQGCARGDCSWLSVSCRLTAAQEARLELVSLHPLAEQSVQCAASRVVHLADGARDIADVELLLQLNGAGLHRVQRLLQRGLLVQTGDAAMLRSEAVGCSDDGDETGWDDRRASAIRS